MDTSSRGRPPLNCALFSFFFNDTATTEIYTFSLHDALPIWSRRSWLRWPRARATPRSPPPDRKSTRLNSSHLGISYAVFCLKKKTIRHSDSRINMVYSDVLGRLKLFTPI